MTLVSVCVGLALILHLAAFLSMRELSTAVRENIMLTCGTGTSSVEAERCISSSAKPSLMALLASIQVYASMRWESLAREKPVLIS